MKLFCQSCDFSGVEAECETLVGDPWSRFDTGDTFSKYECRSCGAICLPKQETKVYVGVVEHKHGFNHYAQVSKEKLFQDIRTNFCDDYYKDECTDPEAYEKAESDETKVGVYFFEHESEWLTWDCMTMELG